MASIAVARHWSDPCGRDANQLARSAARGSTNKGEKKSPRPQARGSNAVAVIAWRLLREEKQGA